MDSEKFPHINIDPQEANLSIPDGCGAIRALTKPYRECQQKSIIGKSTAFRAAVEFGDELQNLQKS